MTIPTSADLGRYEIRSRLGAGAVGAACMAKDIRLGRKLSRLLMGTATCLISLNLFAVEPVYQNAAPARFAEHTIATDLNGGYQVVVSDINHDGKPDLIAVASGMKELIWFENPGWQRHVIVANISRPINCAAW